MATFNHISGAEPSTVTFKAATVSMTRNSSVMHQEIISLGDPDSSLAIAAVLNTAPASTAWALVVRDIGGPNSTIVSVANQVRVSNSSAADLLVRPIFSSTSTDNPVTISGNSTVVQGTNPWTIAGNSTIVFAAGHISSAVLAGGSSALSVRNVWSSTAADQPVRAVLSSTNTDNPVRAVLSSTAADNPVVVSGNSTVFQGGSPWLVSQSMQSSVAPSSGSSGMIVRPVIAGINTTASTNAFASSALTIASSVASRRVYVTAYSITSTAAAATKIAFYSGSTMKWPISLQAVSSGVSGANLAVSAPAYLFRNTLADPLTLNVPSTIAGFRVAVSYFMAP